MKKNKKILRFSLMTLFLFALAAFYYLKLRIDYKEQFLVSNLLFLSAKKIKTIYTQGDIKGALQKDPKRCFDELGDLSSTSPHFLRCNPNYLQCLFEGKLGSLENLLQISFQRKKYAIKVHQVFDKISYFSENKRFYDIISRSSTMGVDVPPYGVKLKISIEKFSRYSQEIILLDSCSDTFLPERVYAYESYQKKLFWDNKGRQIYLDKFLVNVRDVVEWASFDSNSSIDVKKYPKKDLSSPVTNLKVSEMKRYCAFRSKQLLKSHHLDAALYFPSDFLRPYQDLRLSLYPWHLRDESEYLYKVYKKQEKFAVSDKNCQQSYTRDCVKKYPWIKHSSASASWMGINQILGGVMEFSKNTFDLQKNVFLSSQLFFAHEDKHQIGQRIFWDGKGYEEIHFGRSYDKFSSLNKKYLPIGFRCMKYE